MRSVGMSVGQIPYDRMAWYVDRFLRPSDEDELDRYLRLIRRMDSEYLDVMTPKDTKRSSPSAEAAG